MTTPQCTGHQWRVRAVELAGSELWTQQDCRRCGDERVMRVAVPAPVAALVGL